MSDEVITCLLSESSTDLVDGKPSLHAISIPLEAQLGVRDEVFYQLCRITRSEASVSFVQNERRVIVMERDCRFDAGGNQAIDLPYNQSGVQPRHSFILIHRSNGRDSPNYHSISTPSRSLDHPHRLLRVSKRHSASSTSRRRTERFDTRPRDRESIRLRASLLQQLDILLPQIVRTASVFASVCK